MSPAELIQHLGKTGEGSSEVDEAIALIIGWSKVQIGKQAKWRDAEGNVAKRPLRYTTNLNDALTLVRSIAPDEPFGFSWEPGTASAAIPPDTPAIAATPALALCLSAISRLQRSTGRMQND